MYCMNCPYYEIKKDAYIYNTVLCIILPLNQNTKKLVNAIARVFLIKRLWEWR